MTGSFPLPTAVNDDLYRGSLCERRNNRTGADEWVVRLIHPLAEFGRVEWFDIPAGNQTFATADDYRRFCSLVSERENVAVRFTSLVDASRFLQLLRPAQIG